MIEISTLLDEFAVEVQRLADADGAAVVVHLEPLRADAMLLARCGAAAVPEFADEATAWSFLERRRASATFGEDFGARGPIASEADGTVLFRVPLEQIVAAGAAGPFEAVGERRRYPTVGSGSRLEAVVWIGIGRPRALDRFAAVGEALTNPTARDADSDVATLGRFVSLSVRLAWLAYQLSRSLKDPISGLSGRMEFERFLDRALAAAVDERQPLGVLLVSPDDFVMVNHRFGREAGDEAVREIAGILKGSVRQTDGVFRYGGAAFGVVLPATDLDSTIAVADKLRRALAAPLLDGAVELIFTIAGVVADVAALEAQVAPEEMVRRADTALHHAKLNGGAATRVTEISDPERETGHFDPVGGMFTNDTEKDYRNMRLLWDTVSLVSSHADPETVADRFIDRLAARFRADFLALVRGSGEELRVTVNSTVDGSAPDGRVSGRQIVLGDEDRELVQLAMESGEMARQERGDPGSPDADIAYAVPLKSTDTQIGCLLLSGIRRRLELDGSDAIFLDALANQLAVALDRAELAASWIREKDRESRMLRERVRELSQAVNPSKMVFESAGMRELLGTIRRIAPSDATVLIIGESGTGKEMLARLVHEMSHRHDGPYVTVDCGAIAHSLLEAELFGHVKGAYTGAESASEGRIAQAAGGTLFLDEVGELPLDLQAKLLRFVQELEITPVGGNTPRQVDVRIVAATNRELKAEVARGRFRQDLYYRLQVVSLAALPLRDRPADILPLARFFLARFAAQHTSPCQALSADAERLLLAHDWPGNVRELQHCILRAVLMANGPELSARDIELHPEHREAAASTTPSHAESRSPVGVAAPPALGATDLWDRLRHEFEKLVDGVLLHPKRPLPLGRWLQQDLVSAAGEASDDVGRQAARLLGLAESTFRRQLDKVRMEEAGGQLTRPPEWTGVAPLLRQLVANGTDADAGSLIDATRQVLLGVVQERVGRNATLGAAIMGITPPTYKRWVVAQHEV